MFRTPTRLKKSWWRPLLGVWVCTQASLVLAEEWSLYRQSTTAMGTKWRVALYSQHPDTANTAIERAFEVIRRVDCALSNYKADSELNRLCRSAPHADPVRVSEDLWVVLRTADRLSQKSDGAFDVTVGPLTKRWRRARAKKRMPSVELLENDRKRVGFKKIVYDEARRAVRLTQPDMQIDLGGIAKGYAVDRALDAIQAAGVERALVNGGGDLAVRLPPPGAEGWKVEVTGLNADSARHEVHICNAAVATSGDIHQFVELEGQRYSHIVDPRTGFAMTRRTSASVVAPTCMLADGWASVMCVVAEDAVALLNAEDGVEGRVLIADNQGVKCLATAAFPAAHNCDQADPVTKK